MTAGATDHIREFFDRLAATPQPLLHDTTATIRIELDEDGRPEPPWHLTIDRGRVAISRSDAPADAVMRTDPELFESISTGRANALTAALRGRLRISGDVRLLVLLTRLLPGPPDRVTVVPAPAPIRGGADKTPGTTAREARKERTA